MEVEKISKTCIMPSSPTHFHLKTYKISLLDQFVPPIYIPMILYYPIQETTIASNDFISKRSLHLKQSLSKTLSSFYPLAGKIKDELSINCNDEGAYYVEARTAISLSEYLNQPHLSSMKYLLPKEAHVSIPTPGSYVAMIQETTFTCGGFAIGVLVSHNIFDGTALSSFLKAWATMTFHSKASNPYLDTPSIFLSQDAFSRNEASALAMFGPFFKKMKVNTRRFFFNASAIASLKDISGVKNPTRVEVITALLSKCLMDLFKAKSGIDKPLAINHAVNLRGRVVPPFPECSLGNLAWLAAAVCKPEEAELSSLVCQLKEAMDKIDSEFVKKLQGDGGYMKLCEMTKETSRLFGSSGEVEYVSFTSWCNFGLYDTDFGWGKPVWTSCVGSTPNSEILYVNSVILMDAREDRGIEAWAYLDEEDMLLLEKHKQLLQYACVDPNPLKEQI